MLKNNVRDVIQDECAECGLACVSYISAMFDKTLHLQTLRNQYEVTLEGLSFFHLIKIFSDHQMIATGVQVAADSLRELQTPAILLWDNCHFVVLKKTSKTKIEVMDPAIGTRSFTWREVEKFYSGVALEVIPDNSFVADAKGQRRAKSADNSHFFSASAFRKGLKSWKGYLIPLAVLAVIIQLTHIAIPKFISLVIDEVLSKNDDDLLFLLLYIFGFVYLLQAIASYLKIAQAQRLRRMLSLNEGHRVVSDLLNMELKYFAKRMASDILRKIKSVDVFHIIYTNGWIDIFIQSSFAGLFVVLLFFINTHLAMLTLAVTSVMILIRVLMLPEILSRQYASLDAEVRRDNVLLESVDNIDVIKINHNEYRRILAWSEHHSELEYNRSSIEKTQSLIELTVTTLSHIQTLLIIGLGSLSVLQGDTTAGQLLTFIFYKNCLINNIQSIVESHVNIRICSVEVKRLQEILPSDKTAAISFKSSVKEITEPVRKVSFRDISFAYSNLDENFIKNVTFDIHEGEKLVITGPSGCGKTTLMNILSGLLKPTAGEILINNISLARFGLNHFQQQISLVSPNGKLIKGNVMDNIIFESDRYDMTLLENCIEQADFAEVIRSLKSGLNTSLGANGTRLSSGQQQRLMIARALYRKPQLLLLDEPTSHLDDESRQKIIDLIRRLPVACVVVSHDAALIDSIEQRVVLRGDAR